MTQSMDTPKEEIFSMEHKKSLEEKVSTLRDMILEDDAALEKKILKLFRLSLLEHGKDKNQMRQIAQISKILAQSLGLDASYCNRLENAGWVYDIGNVMIAREIYKKEDELSFEEFKVVKNHTFIGQYILKGLGFPVTDLAAIISLGHHEWWNGEGYPFQKKENSIDIASRIVAVADTVGALFRKRPGRKAWEYEKIVEYVESRSGTQFDPDVVEVFLINKELIKEVLSTDLEDIVNRW